MKSILQWFRNRCAGRRPLPPARRPGPDRLRWLDQKLAAVATAFLTDAAAAATRRRWEEKREEERKQDEAWRSEPAIRFSSARSIALADDLLGNAPPQRCDPPFDLSRELEEFFAAHPLTRAEQGAFAQRIREEVNRRFDGDAPAFYRAAGITRFQYSKLLSHPESFRPSKDTALRMALALQYTLDQASGLLALAGHALSPAIPADRVWTVCFLHGMHHLPTVLHFLERYG